MWSAWGGLMYLEEIARGATSPLFETLQEARQRFGDELTDEEYGLARVIASEHSKGSPTEICCIGDAVCNAAAATHRTIVDHVTGGSRIYGAQGTIGEGRKRPVSSARPPAPRHIKAALALLRGAFYGVTDPPARGIALGARRFLDAKTQLALHSSGDARHCHPLVILQRWTFDLPWGGAGGKKLANDPCRLGAAKGRNQEEWVGPIDGVDAYQLMLFRPAGRQQAALYSAARRVIESGGSDQSGPSQVGSAMLELLVVIALATALAMLAGGRPFGGFV